MAHLCFPPGTRSGSRPYLNLFRVSEQVALTQVDPEAEHCVGLLLGLDALSQEPATRLRREMTHADDHRLAPEVGVHPAHETDVELHQVGSQFDDVTEVGDSRAGVVHREAHVVAERSNRRVQCSVVLDDLVLGDFEDDRAVRMQQHRLQTVGIGQKAG